jgi:LysM repeat protein
MRTAAISLVAIALFFSAWQFMLSGSASSPQLPLQVPPIPTPSAQRAQSTSTKITFEHCEMIQYRVLESDSLASIAAQFSVSEGEIMEINHLANEAIVPSMELLIPVCNYTPTGTFHAATFTTTYTPRLISTTSTPPDSY